MAKSVKINGVTYEDVPEVEIPLAEGTGSATFYDASGDTAAMDNVLAGKTFHNSSGGATGTMANNGAISESISKVADSITIPKGYHNGSGKVSISAAEQAKVIAANIKAGVTILGVAGSGTVMDTKDANATAGTIVSGSTAYVNGSKVTGTLTLVKVSQDSTTKTLTIS